MNALNDRQLGLISYRGGEDEGDTDNGPGGAGNNP